MAESDWYEFSPQTQERISAGIVLIAGGTSLVAGLMGYDLGTRRYAQGTSPPTRWMGEVVWLQVVIGLAAIAWGVWRPRKTKATKR